jgi:hypothetical protein
MNYHKTSVSEIHLQSRSNTVACRPLAPMGIQTRSTDRSPIMQGASYDRCRSTEPTGRASVQLSSSLEGRSPTYVLATKETRLSSLSKRSKILAWRLSRKLRRESALQCAKIREIVMCSRCTGWLGDETRKMSSRYFRKCFFA